MNGVILIDKDMDWTSHDVVAKLRGVTRIKKIGHTGTLDPMATGALPICIGKATKIVEYLQADDKVYIADMVFGSKTDTYDSSGEIVATSSKRISEEELRSILPLFTGDIKQLPPMFSAIKVSGVKLYELARKGIEIERELRDVNISKLDLIEFNEKEQTCRIYVHCSSGTYIRSLINDIGEKLSSYANMTSLRRIKCGDFGIENALTLEQLSTKELVLANLIPIDEALKTFQRIDIPHSEYTRITNGMTIILKEGFNSYNTDINSLFYCRGEFIGIGTIFDKSEIGCKAKIKKLLL